MMHEAIDRKKLVLYILLVLPVLLSVTLPVIQVEAAGWIEETVGETARQYDKFPYGNYMLDYYVDTSGDWLPWNWGEGIAKNVSQILYTIANLLWWVVVMVSYFIGWLVQKAYDVDFVSDSVNMISRNIQKISGVSRSGLNSSGLLSKFILLLIIAVGAYFLYLILVKRSMARGVGTLAAFIVTLVMGMGIIAYAPSYVGMVNDFQKGLNKEVLTISNSLTVDGSGGDDSTANIRDSLFNIMIYNPYLLLQYGTTDVSEIGEERINSLLELSPSTEGEGREEIVKNEVMEQDNENMSLSMIFNRLGMVLVLFIVNAVIIFCVGAFAAMMILSQILFVLYFTFLPIPFILSLFPKSSNLLSKALGNVCEVLFLKAGVTIILTITFSISSMCYSLSSDGGFLWMMFLQVVVFVVALTKSRKLLGLMRIGSNDAEKVQGRMRSGIGSVANMLMMRKLLRGGRNRGVSDVAGMKGADDVGESGNSKRFSDMGGNEKRKAARKQVRNDFGSVKGARDKAGRDLEAYHLVKNPTSAKNKDMQGTIDRENEKKAQRNRQIVEKRKAMHMEEPPGTAKDTSGAKKPEGQAARDAVKVKKDLNRDRVEIPYKSSGRSVETYKKGQVSRGTNKFNNFSSRDYDMDELERMLVE